MNNRDEIFSGARKFHFTTIDEWERVQYRALNRARAKRAQNAVDIVRWIIRHLRRGTGFCARIARKIFRDAEQAVKASHLIAANR